jgi:hypothetical protein
MLLSMEIRFLPCRGSVSSFKKSEDLFLQPHLSNRFERLHVKFRLRFSS